MIDKLHLSHMFIGSENITLQLENDNSGRVKDAFLIDFGLIEKVPGQEKSCLKNRLVYCSWLERFNNGSDITIWAIFIGVSDRHLDNVSHLYLSS